MTLGRIKSAHTLKEYVIRLLDAGELDEPLRLIHDFVERIITEPLCTSQIFGSRDLDDLCQRIGRANLTNVNPTNRGTTFSIQDRPVFAYIVTKLQKSGGHSRVIEDFIRARPEARHVILSTEISGKSDTGYVLTALSKDANASLEKAPKGTFQTRLTWLQKRLLEIQSTKTYLFNHHQDSVAVAAIQPEMSLDAFFYHHGDHHLCLGVHLSHLKHIDPHPMGYYNCRYGLGIENIYVPLTIEDKGGRNADLPFRHEKCFTTCTAARSNKIEIPYFVSYLDLLPKLLKATGGRHVHIGRLSPWALHKIRRGLKRYGIRSDRFIYTPWVPSVWKSLHEYQVDLYIASFPYGGGLTLIEAMGAGIPVALHRHIFSGILSGIDLAYHSVFHWRYPEELLNFCTTVTDDDLKNAGKSGRAQFENFHDSNNLCRFLEGNGNLRPRPDKGFNPYSVETDEWALWMERQLTVGRLISRFLYRIYRRFRSDYGF